MRREFYAAPLDVDPLRRAKEDLLRIILQLYSVGYR